jgi:predicted secreted protein
MGPFEIFVTFTIVWWMVFFAALPFGVRGQFEAGPIPHGTEPAAPENPRLGPKAMITTAIAVVLTAAAWVVITFHLFEKFGLI